MGKPKPYSSKYGDVRSMLFVNVAERDDWKCRFCKTTELDVYSKGYFMELHRIKQGKNGGDYKVSNLRLVCTRCHNKLHSRTFKRKGWCDVNERTSDKTLC